MPYGQSLLVQAIKGSTLPTPAPPYSFSHLRYNLLIPHCLLMLFLWNFYFLEIDRPQVLPKSINHELCEKIDCLHLHLLIAHMTIRSATFPNLREAISMAQMFCSQNDHEYFR